MPAGRARSWRRRLVKYGGAAVVLFIAFTVVVHIPAVQYAMGWTHPDGTGACPFGYDKQLVQGTDPARVVARSPGLVVLGFQLTTTTREAIHGWARTHAVACDAQRAERLLECRDVPATALDPNGASLAGATLWFEFDQSGILTTLKTLRRTSAAAAVATAFEATDAALRARVGPPTAVTGSADPAELSRGAFRQAMVAFASGEYRAVVRATNMGNGYVLTENYKAL